MFKTDLQHLDRLFRIYASTSPAPLPSPGLRITSEIRLQSELYIPVSVVRQTAYKIYRASLSTEPVYSSTPFHSCLSWADCLSSLPECLKITANPAILFSKLLSDSGLFQKFIFHSFIPSRFNGRGFGRYPEQQLIIKERLLTLKAVGRKRIKVLDAACGTGEGTWELSLMLHEAGFDRGSAELHGWTLDPLEVWAATNRQLPHDTERSARYQEFANQLEMRQEAPVPRFAATDLLNYKASDEAFDLIVCNGLIGGPITGTTNQTKMIIQNLSRISKPGSTLMISDTFHAGWRKKLPLSNIRSLLDEAGFLCIEDSGATIIATSRVLV